ncbi:MAG: hypothetical protein G01um101456_432 [Parcubacteria group bacterium Gr01-1014_56]|nr:MAG: hypothetical protein G01um101456_432 [Parcubacteria group bacterium Gr01-1014_56]
MKIVLLSSLYPPDIAEPAPYIKELAKRLSTEYEVTVVAYSNFPEKVGGVHVVAVSKRRPLPIRLAVYFFALLRAARGADVLYAENGASVELPAAVVAWLTRTPLVLHLGDTAAHARARGILRGIERFAARRATRVLTEMPLSKPEILPFNSAPITEIQAYDRSWAEHMAELTGLFAHAR